MFQTNHDKSVIQLQRWIAALSVVLFLGKFWAWTLTGSVTILTDALESIVNVIAGFVGLVAVVVAAKPRDKNHPYGHGKIEFVSAAIEGALIIIAGLMVCIEAIDHLLHPSALEKLNWGMLLIAITGGANWLLGLYAGKSGQRKRSATLLAAGKHLCADAYNSIAVVGGLLLVKFTSLIWLDAAIALIFAGIIFLVGYRVLRKSLAGIMDEADMDLLQEVINLLQEKRQNDWIDLHNLRVIQYGAVLHVDAHMTLPYYYDIRGADEKLHALQDLITAHFGGKVELFVHIDACRPYQCHLCAKEDCSFRAHPFVRQVVWNMENVMNDSRHGKTQEQEES